MTSQRIIVMATAFVLGLAGACGGKSKPKTTVPETQPVATTPTVEKPAEALKESAPVSPSLAVSADLAALCSLKRSDDVPPTFDYDKTELSPEDREVLQQIATCMTQGPGKGKTLTLTGRADPRGTEEYNLGLGAQRARAVSVYLQRLGVPEPQLAETTRGAIDARGTDEASWRKDRRVDLDLK
jgi:outer membrane protein OmpA-like peptidoglycan-associated protein